MSSRVSRSAAKPARTISWSSAIITLIALLSRSLPRRDAGDDLESAVGRDPGGERAADGCRPLTHAQHAEARPRPTERRRRARGRVPPGAQSRRSRTPARLRPPRRARDGGRSSAPPGRCGRRRARRLGERRDVAAHREADVVPSARVSSTSWSIWPSAGLWRQLRRRQRCAHDAQQPSHLVQRRAAESPIAAKRSAPSSGRPGSRTAPSRPGWRCSRCGGRRRRAARGDARALLDQRLLAKRRRGRLKSRHRAR